MPDPRPAISTMIREIYAPQILRDYGLTPDQLEDYVKWSRGEMPPLSNSIFGKDVPACWPHFHCDHP